MKEIILSADGARVLYLVPDAVADRLQEYCIEFCDHWLWNSPDAKHLRTKQGACFTEADFIEYLNKHLFPEEKAVLVKTLGEKVPPEYKDLPRFNF